MLARQRIDPGDTLRLVLRRDEMNKALECPQLQRFRRKVEGLQAISEVEADGRQAVEQAAGRLPPERMRALGKAAGDEDRERNVVAFEDGQGVIGIVAIAVVEGKGGKRPALRHGKARW